MLHDELAIQFQNDLLRKIEETDAKGVVIDISASGVVDDFLTQVLLRTAAMARLMGVTTVLAGMRPEVAITMVDLGSELDKIHTVLNIENGIELLRQYTSQGSFDDSVEKESRTLIHE